MPKPRGGPLFGWVHPSTFYDIDRMKEIHLSRPDFTGMVQSLCNQLLPIRNQFEVIVGIERGGIPISSWLAYVLGKEHTSIKISFYGDKRVVSKSAIWSGNFDPCYDGRPFLLVDDIVDSGKTVTYFREKIGWYGLGRGRTPSRYWVASLHWCPENSPHCKPDFFVETKKKSDWIVYPWEERR